MFEGEPGPQPKPVSKRTDSLTGRYFILITAGKEEP